MKRDMELARTILLKLRDQDELNKTVLLENEIEGYTKEQVLYHIKILAQAGLVEAMDASSSDELYWIAESLTWEGQEFVDAINNETVWNKTKDIVKEEGGSIPFEVLKNLAIQVAAKFFGL
ncbi:MAG: DUF2513 domain-containing protein [Armatimonadota bacterium]|nr:DUF2513 domain-containing protein [Armatimonadota bacterium]